MSYAVLSCDLDPVDRHLQGYGFEDVPPCDLIYRSAVPRLLELLADLGVPAVLFAIGRDAEPQAALLRRATAGGHEVASHSLTHPQPFSTLDDGALRAELRTSRERLSQAIGSEVIGFRAPAWDVDGRVLRLVRESAYRYDASIFPTPVLLASRLLTARRGAGIGRALGMETVAHAFAVRRPHVVDVGAGTLVEFPVSVTPRLRLPVYHTLAHLVPEGLFERTLHALLRSAEPVFYEFHAADLLDLRHDGVDARMARHPGMRQGLERKRAMLQRSLTAIRDARPVVTYAQAIERAWVH